MLTMVPHVYRAGWQPHPQRKTHTLSIRKNNLFPKWMWKSQNIKEQNIPGWKGSTRIIQSNSWLYTGLPKIQTTFPRAVLKFGQRAFPSHNSGSNSLLPWDLRWANLTLEKKSLYNSLSLWKEQLHFQISNCRELCSLISPVGFLFGNAICCEAALQVRN